MVNKQDLVLNKHSIKKIAIDSNIFRNIKFINYLRYNKTSIQVYFPTIVYLEVGYYYLSKKVTWENFLEEVQKFNGIFLNWDSIIISEVLKNAIANKTTLPFHHHIRDFLIGTQCENLKISLVTYNINHFEWLKTISVLTPEDFIQSFQ